MTNNEILAVQEDDIVLSGSSYFWVHRIHEPSVPAAGGEVLEGRRWSQATGTWGELQMWHYIPDLAPHPLHILDDKTRESIGFPPRNVRGSWTEGETDTRDWHMLDQLPSPGFVPDNLDPTTKIYTLYAEEYPVDMNTGDPLAGDFAQYRMYEVGERAEDGTIRYHDGEIDTEWTYTSREGSQHETIKQEVTQWASQVFGQPIKVQHNGAGDWELGLPPTTADADGAAKDPDNEGVSDTYNDEVATLKMSFEFELCEECGGDLDAHTFAPDPLGHAHMLCNSEQDDELSPDAARWSPELLRPEWPDHDTRPATAYQQWTDQELTRVKAEATDLTSSITFAEVSASSARDGVAEVEKFTVSLTAAGVSGEPLRGAGTAMELLGQLGTTLDDLAAELQSHTVVAEAYHSVGADAGDKQFNQPA